MKFRKLIFSIVAVSLISSSCVQTEAEKGSTPVDGNSNASSNGSQDKVFKKLHKGTINLIAEKSISLDSLVSANSGFELITISSNGYSISMSEDELSERDNSVTVPVPARGSSVRVSMLYGDGTSKTFSL